MHLARPPLSVALVTHLLNAPVRAVFDRLRREAPFDHVVRLILSNDSPDADICGMAEEDVVRISREDIFRFSYPQKCQSEGWDMAGNLDLVFLEFRRRMPGFEHYWFVEYDVHWEGNWRVLFEHFRVSHAAVLGASVHQIDEIPHKENDPPYPALSVPAGMPWVREQVIKAFLPICRISDHALAALDVAYRAGLNGHYEMCVPTVAAQKGMQVEDYGGRGRYVQADNTNRFYFAHSRTYSHSPGNFVFRPAQRVIARRNTLWHPVKPGGVPAWHPMRVEGGIAKSALEWVKPWIWQGLIFLWFATRWRPLRDEALRSPVDAPSAVTLAK